MEFEQRFRTWRAEDKWPERYGGWREDADGPLGIPKHLSGSDYSGTLVERSNRDAWREDFAEGEDHWWVEVGGGHGTFAIVVCIVDMPSEATEFLDALDEYPSADDDRLSRLETDAQDAAWESWGKKDFLRAVAKEHVLEEDALDASNVDLTFEIFSQARDRSNTYWVNEQGAEVYIDLVRVAKAVGADDVTTLLESRAVDN